MAKQKRATKTKPQNIRFLKSPTGTYNLAYSANDVIPATVLGKTKCDELVVAGYAEYTK
jgi:hypothetical protein